MKPLRVVKVKISVQTPMGTGNRQVLMQINLLVFERPPEAPHENVVIRPAPTVHADADGFSFENACEAAACELDVCLTYQSIRKTTLFLPVPVPKCCPWNFRQPIACAGLLAHTG